MGTEYRKGKPTIEQVEAATRLGLLWAQKGKDCPFKLMNRDGEVVYDGGRPFCSRAHMFVWKSEMDGEEWRPIRLAESGQDFEEAETVDWSTLEGSAPTSAEPPKIGDIVSLRRWEGYANGLHFSSDPDRARLAGQTATVTQIGDDGDVWVKRGDIPTTSWAKGYFDKVVAAAPEQPASASASVGASATLPVVKAGDMVTLRRFSDSEPMGWNSKMEALVGKTVPVYELLPRYGAIRVKDDQGRTWAWSRTAFDVVSAPAVTAASTPAAAAPTASSPTDVPFRPFSKLTPAMIAAHEGEWASDLDAIERQRRYKFIYVNGEVHTDFRGPDCGYLPTGLRPILKINPDIPSMSWRPVDATDVPIPWATLEAAAQASSVPSTAVAAQSQAIRVAPTTPVTINFAPITSAVMQHFTSQSQETTMPQIPATTATSTTPAPKSRFRRAVDTASTRVPVELGLNRLHTLIVKKALKGFKGTKQERQVIANFLTGALKSEYGKAAMAGVLAALIPYAAPMVGKHGPFVEAVADECANRGATIIGVEAGGMVLDAIGPLIDIVSSMLSSAEKLGAGDVREAEVQSLPAGRVAGGGVSATEALGTDAAVPAR